MPKNPAVQRSGTGNVYWDPGNPIDDQPSNGIQTQIRPIAGLSPGGIWIPYKVTDDGAMPVDTGGVGGTPTFDDFQDTTTPGIEQTLISNSVAVGKIKKLSQVLVITRVTGEFTVSNGAQVIGSGRTGPGCDGRMLFTPARPITGSYTVKFTARAGSPAQDVECYVQATDVLP